MLGRDQPCVLWTSVAISLTTSCQCGSTWFCWFLEDVLFVVVPKVCDGCGGSVFVICAHVPNQTWV